ncbi:hypothetical protein [Chondromyces crocatus]|uniref:4Fe-4S ferredoxin-type domain-containing protein n=1 Tax=Chondromyces crocatus TaxID=52 RepID=A0A0K1E911_CHOCO|nr:hypothetical protein [Chondromyces crocatus]AKT37371.1 uncharacterized protein CMC5_015060 [Chondromyces crocatus]
MRLSSILRHAALLMGWVAMGCNALSGVNDFEFVSSGEVTPSGAGGDGGRGGSGGQGGGAPCAERFDDCTGCVACAVEASCEEDAARCEDDADCAQLLECSLLCMQSCGGEQVCEEDCLLGETGCREIFEAGVEAYERVVACSRTACAEVCL